MNYCGNCIEFESDEEGCCKCQKLNMPVKAGDKKSCMYFESRE